LYFFSLSFLGGEIGTAGVTGSQAAADETSGGGDHDDDDDHEDCLNKSYNVNTGKYDCAAFANAKNSIIVLVATLIAAHVATKRI
jgi:hypothetical protein